MREAWQAFWEAFKADTERQAFGDAYATTQGQGW